MFKNTLFYVPDNILTQGYSRKSLRWHKTFRSKKENMWL